ncbi:MAG: hypothetical protein U9O86_00475 [Campylobacterota bacterium]|nr:hypothetical protein [Campylobacterota bacterium]
MKTKFGLMSFAAAAVLMTGCGDAGDTTTTTVSDNNTYVIAGDVNGCVDTLTSPDSLFEGENLELSGVKVSVGNQSALTDATGCFSINDVSIRELNTNDAADDRKTTITAIFEKDGYTTKSENNLVDNTVVGGVLITLDTVTMVATDATSPEIMKVSESLVQSGIMLIEGTDGLENPITVVMNENVTLLNGLNEGVTIVKTVDSNGTAVVAPIALETTVTTSFAATNKELSISTSDALESGAVYSIAVPVQQVTDIQTNFLVDNGYTDDYTDENGVDYVSFDVMIFSQSNNEALAPTALNQMAEDINSLREDSLGLQKVRIANETFSNVAKDEPNNVYMFNKSSSIADFNLGVFATSVQNLLNQTLVDDGTTYSVVQNAARIQFTPSNANYYEVSAIRTDTNVSIGLTELNGTALNATVTDLEEDLRVDADGTAPVELVLTNLPVDTDGLPVEVKVTVTPYSFTDVNGTVAELTIGDNVKPTTALQYSYDDNDDTDSTYSGGVLSGEIIAAIYGGSGELSNGTADDNISTSDPVYTIGTPYLELKTKLLDEQNATSTSPINLPTHYTASEYATFSADLSRSFGVGFTEAVNVSAATLVGDTAGVISSVANTQDNEVINVAFGGAENIAIVSTTNIMKLANDYNASILSFTNAVDLNGNAADKAEVILVDKIPPFVVSADINSSDVNSSTVTFSEVVKAGSINISGINCFINDVYISGKVIQLDGCNYTGLAAGSNTINFSGMSDENANTNSTYTFDANVTN